MNLVFANVAGANGGGEDEADQADQADEAGEEDWTGAAAAAEAWAVADDQADYWESVRERVQCS